MSVNSPTNSASPGQFVAIFGTGLGLPLGRIQIVDGIPAPWPPVRAPYGVEIALDEVIPGKDVLDRNIPSTNTTFAGKAPGLVGVDQINAQLPADAREGWAVPLQVGTYFLQAAESQPVTISIHHGGGPFSTKVLFSVSAPVLPLGGSTQGGDLKIDLVLGNVK